MVNAEVIIGKHKLRPCPNPSCYEPMNLELHRNFDYIVCKGCGLKGPVKDGHPEDAVQDWNALPREGDGGEETTGYCFTYGKEIDGEETNGFLVFGLEDMPTIPRHIRQS